MASLLNFKFGTLQVCHISGFVALKTPVPGAIGQEKYHSLAPMYYRGAAAAIIVYDITRAVIKVILIL
jgi:GTPase SAR1 family protein